jgi:hypothetical protein
MYNQFRKQPAQITTDQVDAIEEQLAKYTRNRRCELLTLTLPAKKLIETASTMGWRPPP